MVRVALALCALAAASCTRNPYVIGEHVIDAGASECDSTLSQAILCSGFEDEDLAAGWTEPVLVNAGELERTGERVHEGRGALRAASYGAESVAVVSAEIEPVLEGELHLRAHLYVPAGVPTDTINIFFLGSDPAPDPFVGLDINLEQGALQVFSPQIDPARQTGTLVIPRDRWFCLRAELAVADMDGSIELFVDDESALRIEAIDTLPAEGVRLVRAGVDWSSAQEASFEIYLDDVALDREPIPCRP